MWTEDRYGTSYSGSKATDCGYFALSPTTACVQERWVGQDPRQVCCACPGGGSHEQPPSPPSIPQLPVNVFGVKFVFTAVGEAGQALQLQEVELFGPNGQLPIASASNPGGAALNGQIAARAIDGNKVDRWSKWLDANFATRGTSTLVLELDSPQLVTKFDFYTANDRANKRDPVSWEVYLEAARGTWQLIDSRAAPRSESHSAVIASRFWPT